MTNSQELIEFINFNLEKINKNENAPEASHLIINIILNSIISLGKLSQKNKEIVYNSITDKSAINDFNSSIENANCQCKHRLGNYISKNIDESVKLIMELINSADENDLQKMAEVKNYYS
jgi:hypothetical protein